MLTMFALPTIVVRVAAEVVLAVVAFTVVLRADRRGGIAVGSLATGTALAELSVPALEMGGLYWVTNSFALGSPPPNTSLVAMALVLGLGLLPPLAHAILLGACATVLLRLARKVPSDPGAGRGWSLD